MAKVLEQFTNIFKKNHSVSTVQEREVLSELIAENK